jgi:ferritin
LLLFIWGLHILPVFLTSVAVTEQAHLPSLMPYRAEVALTMQVIEGGNPFYQVEQVRQLVFAALNTAQTVAASISVSFGASF